MRYLKLISDDGAPTDRLRGLVGSDEADRPKRLQEITKAGYGFLFRDGFHLQTVTPNQLDEAFGKVGPTGDTVRRCVTFFVALAKDAGLQLSPHIEKKNRAARTTTRRKRVNGSATQLADTQEPPARTDSQRTLN